MTRPKTTAAGDGAAKGRRLYAGAERDGRAIDRILATLAQAAHDGHPHAGETRVRLQTIKLLAFTGGNDNDYGFCQRLLREWRSTTAETPDAEQRARVTVAVAMVNRFIPEQVATLRLLGVAYDAWTDTEGVRVAGRQGEATTTELVPAGRPLGSIRVARLVRSDTQDGAQ